MLRSRRSFLKKVALGAVAATTVEAVSISRALADCSSPLAPRLGGGDWDEIRAQFPLGQYRVYLNAGALGPSPTPVLEHVIAEMRETERTGEWDEPREEVARGKLAGFVGAGVDEISLTHNTTEGNNIVAWGLPLSRGDEVIMTTHEHAGGSLPWLNRARVDGIVIRVFEPADTAAGNLERINDLIGPRTRAIAVPHISCMTGVVLPIREISKLAHEKGLFAAFDGAHGAGMVQLDLDDIGCDFYAGCGHKWLLGPKGTGYLYVRRAMLDTLEAKWVGAYTDLGWDMSRNPPTFAGLVPTAHRYDFGSQNAALFSGLGTAVDFLSAIGADKVHARLRELAAALRAELEKRPDKVEVLTPAEEASRAAIVTFRFRGMKSLPFTEYAKAHGFRVRGIFESGTDMIRLAPHIYNSPDDLVRIMAPVDSYRGQ